MVDCEHGRYVKLEVDFAPRNLKYNQRRDNGSASKFVEDILNNFHRTTVNTSLIILLNSNLKGKLATLGDSVDPFVLEQQMTTH